MPITSAQGKMPYTTQLGTQSPVRLSSIPITPVPTLELANTFFHTRASVQLGMM